jgi:hypothetical protein
MDTKQITADKSLVAFCGLYCGACRSYLKGKCAGCKENFKATWCQVRQCCIENDYLSCADCTTMSPIECKKFNNFLSKVIGFVLRSDRVACIKRIKETGYGGFAVEMAAYERQTIRRK